MPSLVTLMPQCRNLSAHPANDGGRPESSKSKELSAPYFDTFVCFGPYRLDLDWMGRLFFLCLRMRELFTESNVLLALSTLVRSQDGRFMAANTAGRKLLQSVTRARRAAMPPVFPHHLACTGTTECLDMEPGTNLKAPNMILQSGGMIRQSRPRPGLRSCRSPPRRQ